MKRTAGAARVATLAVLVALPASACGGTANEAGPQPSPTMTHFASPTTTPEPSQSQSPEHTPEAEPSPAREPSPPADAESSPPADPEPTREPPADPEPPPEPSFPVELAGQDIEVIPTDQPIVALTFDAGANAAAVPSILSTLEQEGITSTFFLTGNFVQSFPDEARAIAAAGHRLGNHSVSHPAFTELTDAKLRAEVLGAQRAILDITGADPRPFFRFPLGDRNQETIAAVNDLGYVAVRWTVDTLGWQGTSGGRSAAEVTERVLDTARPGQIVLMHLGSHPTDGSTLDADALPEVIDGLRDLGYAFVTLDVLL